MIRIANDNDIPAIIDLCREFWKDSGFREEFSVDGCMVYVRPSIDQEMMLVAEESGVIVGFLSGIMAPLMCTDKFAATEMALFLRPEQRRGRIGISLIKHFETHARENGASYVFLCKMHTSMPESIDRLYKSLGYRDRETQYARSL